jgi:acetate kinase
MPGRCDRRSAQGLAWLGLDIDAAKNAANAEVISTPASKVAVLVVPTDEEGVIAQHAQHLLAG